MPTDSPRRPPERLLVVSNRLPLTARRVGGRWRAEASAGGLVAVLGPLMRQLDGRWLGWPGDALPEDADGRASLLASWEEEHGFVPVDLPVTVSRAFYEGFANDTLWPLLHGFPGNVAFAPASWQAYRDANERFAAAILERLRPGDLVWVHDYQLLLVPSLVRAAVPDAAIGLFLHIPFPSSEVFRILPQRDEVLRGMLGADFIGFQAHDHVHNFRRSLLTVLGVDGAMDRVDMDGRTVRLEALPIGIVVEEWERLVERDTSVRRRVADLRTRHAGRHLLLAVDRLDYTKGIPERLRAFRALLRRSRERRGTVTLVQVAVPTRERIPRYQELRRTVSELVGEINGEFGTPEWTPVVYLRRAISKTELTALYAAADVAWVSPLRDGMNLVAKEYVACQRDHPGVVVVSEFAGAAQELGEALRVNPYDELGSVAAIERALDMPADERADRMEALRTRITGNDAVAWSERFIAGLRSAAAGRARDLPASSPPVPLADLVAADRAAARRLLCLDYDGTLVPLAPRPRDAAPDDDLRRLLGALAVQPGSTVVVVSGRARAELDAWLGEVPGLWLAAEHGALLRDPGTGAWASLHPGADVGWKRQLLPLLREFAGRAPGAIVEEKDHAIAWHYRLVDPEFGPWLANELAATLDAQLGGTDLVVLRGNKVVEVRFAWATKGEVVGWLGALGDPPDFELAVGDDRTDEDLFGRLPAAAWTIRVGGGPSRARFSIGSPAEVRGLLGLLSGAAARPPGAGERAGNRAVSAAGGSRAGRASRPGSPWP